MICTKHYKKGITNVCLELGIKELSTCCIRYRNINYDMISSSLSIIYIIIYNYVCVYNYMCVCNCVYM